MSQQTTSTMSGAELVDGMTAIIEPGNRAEADEGLNARLSELSKATRQMAAEQEGMAQELLCVYEQLGAVFEVTRQLGSVKSESQVLALFVDSLRRSYQGRTVVAISGAPEAAAWERRLPAWVSEGMARARHDSGVQVMARPSDDGHSPIEEALVGPVFAGDQFVCTIVLTREADTAAFVASDMMLLESLTMVCGDLIRNHRLVCEMREMSVAMVRSLVNAVDQKDEYTSGHSVRVAYYACLLGREVGMTEDDLVMLNWSALLHDVGKIGIRDDVLKKPGRLTDEEFAHIREHPVRSHTVVKAVPQLSGALDGVLHHHERYDGSGYPHGLHGEDIPLQARVVQVADVFDALTSNRSYRAAHSWEAALAIMRDEAGEALDPTLQQAFDGLIRSRLEGDSDGWDALFRRASDFNRSSSESCDVIGGA